MKLSTILALSIFLIIGGCASTPNSQQMYPGESLPHSQTSTISSIGPVSINWIDNKEVGASILKGDNIAVVLPGTHFVKFAYVYFIPGGLAQIKNFSVTFETKAGLGYLVGISSSSKTPLVIDSFGKQIIP